MTQAIQKTLPDDMVAARKLPGIQPVQGTWLRIDDAYAGQMARRRALLHDMIAGRLLLRVLTVLTLCFFEKGALRVRSKRN